MSVFEFTGTSGGPWHFHPNQDESIYVIHGELDLKVGDERRHLGPGESIFLPRKIAHVWASLRDHPAKIVNVYQPAGKMEEFFREVGRYGRKPQIHEALSNDEFHRLFHDHGMDVAGPPLTGEWQVDGEGRIIQTLERYLE